jgi:hypothetical protein
MISTGGTLGMALQRSGFQQALATNMNNDHATPINNKATSFCTPHPQLSTAHCHIAHLRNL